MIDEQMIKDMLYTNPLSLFVIKDKQVIQYLNDLVPYSTAFEIECSKSDKYNNDAFTNIPDIMDVRNDGSEQRYRIPNGLRGIICVYNISAQLKVNSLLNELSSIHYHVDCTDCWQYINPIAIKNEEFILSELDTWLEGDTASNRSIGNWFKLNTLQTIEFRLGEMTFDYKTLLKRIIHCNAIVKKFKNEVYSMLQTEQPIKYKDPDIKAILDYWKSSDLSYAILQGKIHNIRRELEEIDKVQHEVEEQNNVEISFKELKGQIRNRVHKVNKPNKL